MFERNRTSPRVFSFLVVVCVIALSHAQERARERTDEAVRQLLEQKAAAASWKLDRSAIWTDEKSRYHDSSNTDNPPEPMDDPESAKLMFRRKKSKPEIELQSPVQIESEAWRAYLPKNDSGEVVLNLENAITLGLLHSRGYQSARESLYLTALDVTEQRFSFESQFSLTNNSNRQGLGRRRESNEASDDVGATTTAAGEKNLGSDTNFELNRRTATGAEMVLGLANSVLFDLSANSETVLSSVVNFGVVQPLLRFSAREFVLEELTQSERNLLADVRRMKQFQQGFYIDVVAGASIAEGPSGGSDGGVGSAPLVASSGGTSGFLGLLQTRQQIRNQESSVAALRDSLAQLQAAFDAGRIDNRLQVDQARQALYNGQSSLLTEYSGYDSAIDDYKVTLGLPPELEVKVEDDLLDRFNLVDPAVSELQSRLATVLDTVRQPKKIRTSDDLADELDALQKLQPSMVEQLNRAHGDLKALDTHLPERRLQLEELKKRPELQNVHVDPDLFDASLLEGLGQRLGKSLDHLEENLLAAMRNLDVLREVKAPDDQLERARSHVITQMTGVSSHLLELSLIQAAARLETVSLMPVEIDFESAFGLSEGYRLDWMNARADLVDSWRQVAVTQEALKTGLNLIVNGDVPTLGNDAFNFDSESGRLQLGLELDTPLRRLTERNAYKQSLISYQQARRSYMLYEDRVKQSLRNTLRTVRLSQLNFEVRRAAVRVAIAQVDLARLRLNEPPKPGEGGAQFGATTARDLVSALGDLLGAQNDFLNVWVNFEVLRMLLDYELGTMKLDNDGAWVDPGTMTPETLKALAVDLREIAVEDSVQAGNSPVVEVSAPEASTRNRTAKKRGIFSIFRKN